MAQASLKNVGLLNNKEIDFAKTKTTHMASEKFGKDLSIEEYSMTGVQVYVVSRLLD